MGKGNALQRFCITQFNKNMFFYSLYSSHCTELWMTQALIIVESSAHLTSYLFTKSKYNAGCVWGGRIGTSGAREACLYLHPCTFAGAGGADSYGISLCKTWYMYRHLSYILYHSRNQNTRTFVLLPASNLFSKQKSQSKVLVLGGQW